jgi:hypothetical protein
VSNVRLVDAAELAERAAAQIVVDAHIGAASSSEQIPPEPEAT